MKYSNNIQKELYLSEKTYKEASNQIKSRTIGSFLKKLAKTKNSFRRQLPEHYKVESQVIDKHTVDFTNASTQLVLVKCLSGEENLIREYQKVLSTNRLNHSLYLILSRQLNNTLATFNQLRAIKLSGSLNQ